MSFTRTVTRASVAAGPSLRTWTFTASDFDRTLGRAWLYAAWTAGAVERYTLRTMPQFGRRSGALRVITTTVLSRAKSTSDVMSTGNAKPRCFDSAASEPFTNTLYA